MLRVCIAGVTGWQGAPLAEAIRQASDLELLAGVARGAAGRQLENGTPIFGDLASALDATPVDVMVDYTAPAAVAAHAATAIERGVHAMLGTSGLTDDDLQKLDRLARKAGVGVVAAPNFSPLATLLGQAAALIGKQISHWEIVEYASAEKPDAPSSTARDLQHGD